MNTRINKIKLFPLLGYFFIIRTPRSTPVVQYPDLARSPTCR